MVAGTPARQRKQWRYRGAVSTTIGIIGPGHIGANIARLLVGAAHEVTISFSPDRDRLAALGAEIGASVDQPSEAAARRRLAPS